MKAILNDFEVNEIVKMMREWTDKSQENFAKGVNYSTATIRNIEQNRRNLYLHTFLQWAKINKIKITMEKE